MNDIPDSVAEQQPLTMDQKHDDLYEDFIALCEMHRHALNPAQFGHLIISFACRLLYGTAPHMGEAHAVIINAITDAHKQVLESTLLPLVKENE